MDKDQQTSAISISFRPKAASDISESDASILLIVTVEYSILTSNLERHWQKRWSVDKCRL